MTAQAFLLGVLLLTLLAAVPPAGAARARVALIFEHAGASLAALAPIYAMHQPFGLSILPHTRYAA